MRKDFNTDDLIGKEIGVLDDEGNVIKDIKITKATNTKNGLIVFDEEGTPYHEDELNWHYKVTPEYLLYHTLEENGFELPNWDADLMEKVFKEFMDSMIKSGYIGEKE